MRTALVTLAIVMGHAVAAWSGEPAIAYTPQEIIEKSIAYHDPNGVWETGRIELGIHTTYSDALAEQRGIKEADLTIRLSPYNQEFSYTRKTPGDVVEITVRKDKGSVVVNGSATVSDGDRERLRIREPAMYRDYCEYLYGMPMKLNDPGTILHPNVHSRRFKERKVWVVKATYDPTVGKDTWYFYFDHDTFALVGYRFYHDESKNDGEYITLEGETVDEESGLRLPKTRAWYYNADDGHLATDDIVSLRS